MATWKSRGLRGSLLEDLINRTNEKYRETGLALIQKAAIPRADGLQLSQRFFIIVFPGIVAFHKITSDI